MPPTSLSPRLRRLRKKLVQCVASHRPYSMDPSDASRVSLQDWNERPEFAPVRDSLQELKQARLIRSFGSNVLRLDQRVADEAQLKSSAPPPRPEQQLPRLGCSLAVLLLAVLTFAMFTSSQSKARSVAEVCGAGSTAYSASVTSRGSLGRVVGLLVGIGEDVECQGGSSAAELMRHEMALRAAKQEHIERMAEKPGMLSMKASEDKVEFQKESTRNEPPRGEPPLGQPLAPCRLSSRPLLPAEAEGVLVCAGDQLSQRRGVRLIHARKPGVDGSGYVQQAALEHAFQARVPVPAWEPGFLSLVQPASGL